jgi:ribosomal protein S18 acetylase RimI-like enzyme
MTVQLGAWSMRPATQCDPTFLLDLHRTTMRAVIEKAWGWDENWQKSDLEKRLAECDVYVLSMASKPIGALFLERRPGSIYVRELQVVPEFQGQGIGTSVLRQVINDAAAKNKCVALQVAIENVGARRLYERLGFQVIREVPPVVEMQFALRSPIRC